MDSKKRKNILNGFEFNSRIAHQGRAWKGRFVKGPSTWNFSIVIKRIIEKEKGIIMTIIISPEGVMETHNNAFVLALEPRHPF